MGLVDTHRASTDKAGSIAGWEGREAKLTNMLIQNLNNNYCRCETTNLVAARGRRNTSLVRSEVEGLGDDGDAVHVHGIRVPLASVRLIGCRLEVALQLKYALY
jgi:hypothetical protein